MSCLQRTGSGKRRGAEQSRGDVFEKGEQLHCAVICHVEMCLRKVSSYTALLFSNHRYVARQK